MNCFRAFCALLLFTTPLFCQVETQMLSPKEMNLDVRILRNALESTHPGLYWYTTKEEFSQAWDDLNAQLNEPLSEVEFFRRLLPVVAKVKCAHTLFYPSESITSNGSRFPFDIRLIDKRIFLFHSPGDAGIPDGSELISIDNTPTQQILEDLLPLLQAQGGNAGWKKVTLENDFHNYLYYLTGNRDAFVVKYLDHKTGVEQAKTVTGRNDDAFRNHWRNWYPREDGPPLRIEYIEDSAIAVLTIKSFVPNRAKAGGQDFDKDVARYFDAIRYRRIQRLIIDLRGNEGGNNPEALYSFIARGDEMDTAFKTLGKGSIATAANHFEGPVVLLANERSVSAQETFVSIFKLLKRGPIVGRPTAGCFKGLCSGKKLDRVLTNSRFLVRIPMHETRGVFANHSNLKPGEGIPPDYYVEETINDILNGNDPVLTYAIELSRKMQPSPTDFK